MSGLTTNYALAAESKAIHSYGTLLSIGAYIVPTGLDAFTVLPNLKSAMFSGHNINKIDVTHLFSPDKYKEFIPGFADGGQIALEFWHAGSTAKFIQDNMPHLIEAGVLYTNYLGPTHGRVRLLFEDPAGNTITAKGFLQPFNIGAPLDDAMSLTCTFDITGKPVLTKLAGAQ